MMGRPDHADSFVPAIWIRHKKTATRAVFLSSVNSKELTFDIALNFASVKLTRTADFVRTAVHF
jgi:hypothetical protein